MPLSFAEVSAGYLNKNSNNRKIESAPGSLRHKEASPVERDRMPITAYIPYSLEQLFQSLKVVGYTQH